jgi:hypothetical protein
MRHLRVFLLSVGGLCLVLTTLVMASPAAAYVESDWQHVLSTVQTLRTDPPDTPIVLLLGGSGAREATASDWSWGVDVKRRYGSAVATYDLGSKKQTFEQDVAIVNALPRIPMLIFIGINRGRFTTPPTKTTTMAPVAQMAERSGQHHYANKRPRSLALKQSDVRFWVHHRYAVFQELYGTNLAELDRLLALCLRRGYQPVLLELPRNQEVIGHAFDAATSRQQKDCRRLAAKYSIPNVSFLDKAALTDADFYDLDHLARSGWPKYQGLLADETARLLTTYPTLTTRREKAALAFSPAAVSAVVAVVLVAAGLVVWRRRTVVHRRRRTLAKRGAV